MENLDYVTVFQDLLEPVGERIELGEIEDIAVAAQTDLNGYPRLSFTDLTYLYESKALGP